MNKGQLERIESNLLELRKSLLELLESRADYIKPVELSDSIGRLTRIDAIQQQQMALATQSDAKKRLKAVESALEELKTGEYGLCLDCGEPINFRRLLTRPESKLCIECKEARE